MAYVLKIFYANKEKKADLLTKALALDAGKLNKAEKILRQQLVNWQADPKAKTAETMSALVAVTPKKEAVRVLSDTQALYTFTVGQAAVLKTGQKINYENVAGTMLFTNINGAWKATFYQESASAPN
ncbi:MAG: hypothetical protein H7319_21590 [Spirosoma sp.]|nr:hypothetical protein [Spirosoma sp.]